MNEFSDPELSNNSNSNDLIDADSHENQTYKSINFNQYDVSGHTFENCVFESCHFIEMSLSKAGFLSCKFNNSEIVLTKLEQATLNTVDFIDCKVMGLSFADCNKFGFFINFENCLIDNTSYYSNNLKKAKFVKCQIRNTDFSECDMREAVFSNTKFERTVFKNCNLEKADFRSASDYAVDPFNNKIKKAKFTLPEAQSFLDFLGIDLK
jgi:fluoroquinolone resistance protein